MMKEKIKGIKLAKKKIFIVGIVIGVIFLIGSSLVLSENAFPKKVVNIHKYLNIGGVLKEIKEEKTPVIDSQKCEEEARKEACWRFMGYADPNERSREICDIYLETDGLMIKGKWDEAKDLLEKAMVQFPESRHLHKQLAYVLWYSCDDKDQSVLKRAIKEAERALNIGLSFGKVDYHLTGLLSRLLSETKDIETLDRIFERVFATESSAVVYLDYAQALNQMNDPRAKENKSSETLQVTTAISDTQAIKGLSYLIWGEARGETLGGMRAEGWVVRSRVLRGSVGSPPLSLCS
ncbi:hypothetical protein KJ636_05390 [Patescibacteria group bacterium]|nr:hypothetical protein [Patescibacteria group bacterium]